MSATVITQGNNPTLWQSLMDEWEYWKNPGYVTSGAQLYKVEVLANQTVQFRFMESMEYLDSRSLKKSKKSSYKELSA